MICVFLLSNYMYGWWPPCEAGYSCILSIKLNFSRSKYEVHINHLKKNQLRRNTYGYVFLELMTVLCEIIWLCGQKKIPGSWMHRDVKNQK